MQKTAFLEGEGDSWFDRNRDAVRDTSDPVLETIVRLGLSPSCALEIGCGAGQRIGGIADRFGADCFGFDPSSEAVAHAAARYPAVSFKIGTADHIDMADGSVDLLVFGFCLYLTDPVDHFSIAKEADRVLKDGGVAVVLDFCTPRPYRNRYSHKDGVFSHKMEFSRMLTWHPSYRLIHREYLEHGERNTFSPDEAVAVDLIVKESCEAFPTRG